MRNVPLDAGTEHCRAWSLVAVVTVTAGAALTIQP
jgi:hypothetical protein